jgi:CheY-like chemotaxis protein
VVVDDDAPTLEAMNGLLCGWNCSVYSFSSAEEALESVSSRNGQPPDLIIADYSLPDGRSGVELIADLRSAIGADIAAFLISGDTSPDRLREVRASGLQLLHKPVAPIALRAMLVRHLNAHQSA